MQQFAICRLQKTKLYYYFFFSAYLSIPDIEVRPSIDEVQMVLVQAGKIILSVSKGVATWKKSLKATTKKGAKGKDQKPDQVQALPSESTKETKLYRNELILRQETQYSNFSRF